MIVLNEDILKTAVRMVLESSKPLKDIVDRYYSNVEPEKIGMPSDVVQWYSNNFPNIWK